jgi:alpha-amylase/alpha-mannosidase (GH57 family)
MTIAVEPTPREQNYQETNPLTTAQGIYIIIHGHFYQPPRENPYLNIIERQPSAAPFHDWNERIFYECYRNNVFARMFNDQGEIVGIVNNFEYLSFNLGATLMSWLKNYDSEVYAKIIEADRRSCERLNGHGNAIAQVYNHIIMPLANERDKYTQIRWGKADFKAHFGRNPEGMWLAETAVDYPTLEVLIAEGIKFIILAPSQAERCRPIPTPENPHSKWLEVGGGQIDPTRPYRCYVNENDYIDILFYDGPISGDMGFGDVLSSSHNLFSRLQLAVRGDNRQSQVISVATDGETFGHHKYNTEKCLAYAITQEFLQQEWTVTNFAHYLSLVTPTWEVELKPVTAWSCYHGVERWQDDCGCGSGGETQQQWRKPLRESLNWLRDELIKVYDNVGYKYFTDPWLARDEYIEVILDRSASTVESFLIRHSSHQLSPSEQIDALRLLEMQRHSLLMFTSCGWFFEEISRPEGTQILRYAGRALELAGEVAGVQLEQEFLARLATAPSNEEKYLNGAEVYQKLVIPSQVNLEQVAAHYAISSLFTNYQSEQKIYCYSASQLDYQKQQIGSLTLAIGQVRLISEITWESTHFIFAVLHLGGWDFHCCIQPFSSRLAYSHMKEQLFSILKQASVVEVILQMSELFGNKSFDLQHLFAEERLSIMQKLTTSTKKRLDQLYTQVYRDNYSILLAFQRDEVPVPQELQVAAEVAISYRCLKVIQELKTNKVNLDNLDGYLIELEAIATEANDLRCKLTIPKGKESLEKLILHAVQQILFDRRSENIEEDSLLINRLLLIGEKLQLKLWLDPVQETYYYYLHEQILPNLSSGKDTSLPWQGNQLRELFKLGKYLGVYTDY